MFAHPCVCGSEPSEINPKHSAQDYSLLREGTADVFASDVEAGKKKSASAWRLLALAKEETLVRCIQGAVQHPVPCSLCVASCLLCHSGLLFSFALAS